MPDGNVLAAGQYDECSLYMIRSSSKQNSLTIWSEGHENTIFSWKGKSVTGCAFYSGKFAFIENDKTVSVYDKTLKQLEHNLKFVHAICFLSEDLIIISGQVGQFCILDINTGHLTNHHLKDFNTPKPGRVIHGLTQTNQGCVMIGSKQLLVSYCYKNKKLHDLNPGNTSEDLFFDCVEDENTLWLSGTSGPRPIIVRKSEKGIDTFFAPTEDLYAPIIKPSDNKLLIATESVYYGLPEKWEKLGQLESGCVCLAFLDNEPKKVFCITMNGTVQSFDKPD